MNRTTLKKWVGTVGLAVGAASAWLMDPDNHAALVALLPHHGTQIALTTSWLALLATLWGHHPGSSPSVADAVAAGNVAVEIEKARADAG